jgi:hypothetical protein
MHSNATYRGRANILQRPNRLNVRSGSVAVSTPGAPRMLLALGLRNKDDDPAGMAVTTLMLIFVRSMLRALHKLPLSGNFELPNDPLVILASPRHSGGRRKPCPPGGREGKAPCLQCQVTLSPI